MRSTAANLFDTVSMIRNTGDSFEPAPEDNARQRVREDPFQRHRTSAPQIETAVMVSSAV